MIDPPSADVTAHVRRDARRSRAAADDPRARERASTWLLRAQEPDGSWFGRWGANHLYGTGAARARARRAPAMPRDALAIRRAVRWLETRPERRRRLRRGPALVRRPEPAPGAATSTASQTAWALLALLAAGERGAARSSAASPGSRATQRAGRRLGRAAVHRHRLPGRLLHPLPPLPLVFPLMALGRYLGTDLHAAR